MKKNTDIGNYIVHYFQHKESNEKDPVLTAWLDENESNRKLFRQYERIWNESVHYMEKVTFDSNAAWENINHIHQQKNRSHRRLRNLYYTLSGVAASALLFLALSLFGVFDKEDVLFVSMNANYGSRSDITLPDGSTVKLNSGSDITYSYNPQKKIREVHFQGEGFFEISKSNDPFVIKTKDNLEIKVLGTSFNLQAYPEDRIIQASLVEGCIEMSIGKQILHMRAGDIAVFDKNTHQVERKEGILSHTYGWIDNKLYMHNMSLADVCKHMERWYNVEISVQPELGELIHYNGVLQEQTITDIMNSLSHLSKISYQMKGKHISITAK